MTGSARRAIPRRARLAASALLLLGCVLAPARSFAATADATFTRLGDEFLDQWFASRPHAATRIGIHDHDEDLIPVTETSLAQDLERMRGFRRRLDAIPRAELSFDHALEWDVLSSRVDSELLDLEVIKPWNNNPNSYLPLVAGSVQNLMQRDFAPLCVRLRSTARRMSHVPEVLRAARINLKRPPRIATETAIAQFEGVLRLYRAELPALAARCKDPGVQAALTESDTAAVRAVESFLTFLREDLLPRSDAPFALGAEVYARKLAADEMERTPLDTLFAQAEAALAENQAQMRAVAEQIAPGKGVAAALATIEEDRPSADGLVPFVVSGLDRIRAFLRSHPILTLPATDDLRVRETPSFQRSLSFASMQSPGVWEKKATEAFYNVTPVEPEWNDQQKRDHLAFFNRCSADVISIHEALPGHYYQFLALRRSPSRIRQAFTSGSYTEGWGHYCEQMMVEQGFGSGDPCIRIAQLVLANRRIGRFLVGIALHTRGMTYEDAVKLFEERCYMTPITAAREARRGTMDPTYLVYTLGKWRILALRDEVKERLGAGFDLKRFHDALLHQGASPMPVVRAGVLHELGIETTAAN